MRPKEPDPIAPTNAIIATPAIRERLLPKSAAFPGSSLRGPGFCLHNLHLRTVWHENRLEGIRHCVPGSVTVRVAGLAGFCRTNSRGSVITAIVGNILHLFFQLLVWI